MQLQALNGEVGNSMCPSSREGDDANCLTNSLDRFGTLMQPITQTDFEVDTLRMRIRGLGKPSIVKLVPACFVFQYITIYRLG
jgi:hypothetical protein